MENKENIEEKSIESIDSVKHLMDIGLKEVSNKTFIHQEELTRFLSGNFENINQTKAMGFIQILQREYRIDLSELKQKYLEYSRENATKKPKIKESLIMEEVKSEERTKSFFSIIFLLLAVGAIAYLIDKYDLLNFDKPMNISTATIEEKKSDNVDLNKIVLNDTKPKVEKKEEPKEEVKQEIKNELDLNKVLEENKKDDTKEATQQSDTQTTENDSNNLDLSQLNSDLANNDTNQEATEQNTTSDEQSSSDTDAVTNELYIMPSSKVWIGTIDLDTLKKHDFLTPRGKRVDIDTSKNQLIMIGHKFVKIYLNGELVSFKRKGPVRFKYMDGNLTEINRREFNELAKGRQW